MRQGKQALLEELRRCKGDWLYFLRNYAHIEHRQERKAKLFRPNKEQMRVYKALRDHDKVYVLKARKLGMSTAAVGWIVQHLVFNENFKAATLTHDEDSANEMLSMKASLMIRRLPDWMKMHDMQISRMRSDRIEWAHGGVYRAVTYRSEKVRSADVDFLHFSEFSAYTDVEDVISANENAMRPGGKVLYETTARGLGFAFDLWRADNGICKLFFPWTLDHNYQLKDKPHVAPEVWEWAVEYGHNYGLKEPQINWAAWKMNSYGGKITKLTLHHFHREYPVTAELAFSVASGRVFQAFYPDARPSNGHRIYKEPEPFHAYTMGVDTATGSPTGDYSAWCILDVTDRQRPQVVATFYDRLTPVDFAETVMWAVKKYQPLVVPERNMGATVIDALEKERYPWVWTELAYQQKGSKRTHRLGFHTGVMSRKVLTANLDTWLGGMIPRMDPVDDRLKAEMNDFVYSDDAKQQPEHMPGAHDDLLFATALALEGMKQAHRVSEEKTWSRPSSIQEMRQYRAVTGKAYDPGDVFDDDVESDLEFMFGGNAGSRRGLQRLDRILRNEGQGIVMPPRQVLELLER